MTGPKPCINTFYLVKGGRFMARKRITNAKLLKSYIAGLILKYDADEIDTKKFRALMYGTDFMLKAIKLADLETKVKQIEDFLKKEGKI